VVVDKEGVVLELEQMEQITQVVVLVEMVIDPMCSVAFEGQPGEPDLMQQPPRPLSEPLVGGAQLALAAGLGVVLLAVVLLLNAMVSLLRRWRERADGAASAATAMVAA